MFPKQDVQESYFEKFSTSTVIRVFSFIRTSGFLVERLFWIVVLLGFSFGTVWNVRQTISTFLSEPTASRMSFLANITNGMSFPDAVLCFEIRSDILVKMYESKINNVIDYINREVGFPRSLEAKMMKIKDMEDQRIEKPANLTTDHQDMAARYHLFEHANAHIFNEDEVALLGLTTAMLVRLLELEAPLLRTERFSMPPMASIQRLHKAYSMKEANFSDLLMLTAEMMCTVLQIRLTRFRHGIYKALNDYSAHYFCKNFSLAYFGADPLGDEVVCYRHSADNSLSPLTFYSGFDQVMLSVHVKSLYKESSAELRKIIIDLRGKNAIYQQPPLLLQLNKRQTVNFSLETVSTAVNLRRNPCWENRKIPRYQCTIWCYSVEARLVSCNCLSLYSLIVPRFASLPNGLRSCAMSVDDKLEHFADERCRSAFVSFDSINNCSQQCYEQDCESFLFASTEEANDPSLAYLNASTVVSLRLTKFVYQKVDEYLLMDAMALITSLGGNLSLYLGASFLALIHIVVFFVKLPFEMACNAKQSANVHSDAAPAMTLVDGRNLEEVVKALVVSSTNQTVMQLRDELTFVRHRVEALDRQLRSVFNFDRMAPRAGRPGGRGAVPLRFESNFPA